MPVAAIQTSKLSKDYGLGHGLFDLDLTVSPQEVFGFLGPNGAGKSTTIRCLMGMIRPTQGSAHIFGLDCLRDAVAVKRKVGYMPGDMPQFGSLRGREVVAYLGGFVGMIDPAVVRKLAERFDLDLGRRYREYSSGNKKKLGIVLAFMHRPVLLILDEPTGGLDPLNQQEFYRLVNETRDAGATIFLSSHILSEVEHVCDKVGIIRAGRLVKVAELDEIHRIRVHRLEIEFAPDTDVPEAAIRAAAGIEDVVVENHTVTCVVKGPFDPLLKALHDATVTNLVSHEPSLEEVFLTYYRTEAPAEELSR
jgi:ABC-2 type transport system ATP-binding protein